jgi:hypothetical protein
MARAIFADAVVMATVWRRALSIVCWRATRLATRAG